MDRKKRDFRRGYHRQEDAEQGRIIFLEKKFSKPRFFATVGRGFEEVLAEELREIFKECEIETEIRPSIAGCYFHSSWEGCIVANMASRCASRILMVVAEADVKASEDLHAVASLVDWSEIFPSDLTFAVNADVSESFINNSMFAALKVKDAICDVFRERTGGRPNVNTENPDVRVYVRLRRQRLSIAVDTTGEPLFKRGYRVRGVEAPLKESLAAALLRMTGWNRLAKSLWLSSEPVHFVRADGDENQSPTLIPRKLLLSPWLLDPMCGSGTFVIEAALALLNWKPNVRREFFSFMELCHAHHHQMKSAYKSLRSRLIAAEKSPVDLAPVVKRYAWENGLVDKDFDFSVPFLRGGDTSAANLSAAMECAAAAGVSKIVSFSKREVDAAIPHAPAGIVITNPPYGERMGGEVNLQEFYKKLGDRWKHHFPGWTVWMLSANPEAMASVGLRPTRKISVYNGNLSCRFSQYVIYPGDGGRV